MNIYMFRTFTDVLKGHVVRILPICVFTVLKVVLSNMLHSDEIVDSVPEVHDDFVVDDLNVLQGSSFESNCSSDIKNRSSESLTPRSILTTPRTSQIESLLHKKRIISEHENNQQV